MVEKSHLFGIIILSLMVMFALIHLGVSIGIIVTNKSFGNIFRPETGLASFNIVIAVLGFAVGIIGIICILTNRDAIGKFVAIGSIVLGIFTFFSLITALIINSKSATFVSSRFSDKMVAYANSSDAQKIIDRVQNDYNCCGESSWLDWGAIYPESATNTTTTTITTSLGTRTITTTTPGQNITTVPEQNITITTTPPVETDVNQTGETNTIPVTGETDTIPVNGTTVTQTGETIIPVTGETDTTSVDGTTINQTGETNTISSNETGITPMEGTVTSLLDMETESTPLATVRRRIYLNTEFPSFVLSAVRRRRQSREIMSIQRNLFTVPYYSTISVPNSCCPTTSNSGNNSSQATCTSSRQLYTSGCVRSLIKRANNQDMGIAIINCFMILLAFTAVPFLFLGIANADVLDRRLYRTQVETMRHFDNNPHGFPSVINTLH